MSIINPGPYLKTSRSFPHQLKELAIEVDRAYLDIASAMNDRTIGLYPTGRQAVTGNSWYITTHPQQSLRQVYTFTSAGNIPHGIDLTQIYGFVHIYGTFSDGTKWYPLSYPDPTGSAYDVSISVGETYIEIMAGGSSPAITKGNATLEWLTFT